MNRFLHGFTNELLKLGAFSTQPLEAEPYDTGSPATKTMDQFQGAKAKTGLKTGPAIPAMPAPKKISGPLTTPTQLMGSIAGHES